MMVIIMDWIAHARKFYGRAEVRSWVDGCAHRGDTRMWLAMIDDVLDSSNNVSRHHYSTLRRQYEFDSAMWTLDNKTTYENGAIMIRFSLMPGSYQPSGYVDFSRVANEWYQPFTKMAYTGAYVDICR